MQHKISQMETRQYCFSWTRVFIAAKKLLERYLHLEAGLHIDRSQVPTWSRYQPTTPLVSYKSHIKPDPQHRESTFRLSIPWLDRALEWGRMPAISQLLNNDVDDRMYRLTLLCLIRSWTPRLGHLGAC
jgi:hypothetical protein